MATSGLWQLTTNTTGDTFVGNFTSSAQFVVDGTFDGATVTLETSVDNGDNWHSLSGLTEGGVLDGRVTGSYGELYRVVTTGGGAGLDINARLIQLVG